jgi:hypothetical protein
MKFLMLIASLVIVGCSSGSDDEDERSVLLDSAQAPVEKAEAVEDVVLESKDRIDEAIDAADD